MLELASTLRGAVVVTLLVSVAVVGRVFLLYFRAWRAAPREHGLTPFHVALVSLCVLGYQVLITWALLEGLQAGQPASATTLIRTAGYGVVTLGVLVALWAVARVQKRRVQFSREKRMAVVTVQQGETVHISDE